jgi:hypothetical protein
MSVDARAMAALDLKTLTLPPYPKVERVEVEDYVDSDGEPALRVLVVIDEATDIDKNLGREVGQLKDAIRDSLQSHGISLFAYIFLAKPSELVEIDDQE